MGPTVRVDPDLCISSGRCVADAPALFRFDEDEIAEATGDSGALPLPRLREIAANCPSGAISLDGNG